MKISSAGALIVGILAGAVATAGLMLALGGRSQPEKAERAPRPAPRRDDAFEKENRRLRDEVATLRKQLEARPEPEAAPEKPKETAPTAKADLRKDFDALASLQQLVSCRLSLRIRRGGPPGR